MLKMEREIENENFVLFKNYKICSTRTELLLNIKVTLTTKSRATGLRDYWEYKKVQQTFFFFYS